MTTELNPSARAPKRFEKPMLKQCDRDALLERDRHGVMRVPFLVKGQLVVPPLVDAESIKATFADLDRRTGLGKRAVSWAAVGGAQVLRERHDLYTVMPAVEPHRL